MDPRNQERLAHARLVFGRDIRRSRQIAGISQQRLAVLSGVSQSVISRLERGKAPRLALERLLMLHHVLGNALPLGACPHDHHCVWRALTAGGQRSHTEPLASGVPFWGRFRSARPPGLADPTEAAVPADPAPADPQSSAARSHESSSQRSIGSATPTASTGLNGVAEAQDRVLRVSPAIFPWED